MKLGRSELPCDQLPGSFGAQKKRYRGHLAGDCA